MSDKSRWLDDPKNVRKILYALFALCGALFLFDFFYVKEDHFPLEGWFGFYGVYGFAACVFLVLTAKQMRKIVKRDEEYYDR